ncbi:MAG: hypothetical protein ABIR96_08205 [Bdellovibrionota bacterium]
MKYSKIANGAVCAMALTACTGQLPGSFRYQQQVEGFKTDISVNTKIDMLWVVDNSPSMAPSQKKIRDGFRQFAQEYMKPNWDIHVAVISQDTYLAHPSFAGFLNGVGATGSAQRYSREAGYQSTYLNPSSGASPKRTTAFVTPSFWSGTAISSTGTVTGVGVKLRQAIPEYGGANQSADVSTTNPSFLARLVPGRHDGPLATLCWTSTTNPFFYGVAQCYVRDKETTYSGVDNCVAGGTGILDSSVQCVNTLMNNTVRSGKAIISTKPPEGTLADAAWTDRLYKDFVVNLSGGVSGYPYEMFFDSISQLLKDNEASDSDTKFFRPGALRVIVIVTDEDDQSTMLPASGQITPDSQYNGSTSCEWKTVDSHTYRTQSCPKPDKIRSVASFKDELDTFFRTVDGDPTGDPNYFVTTITPKTGSALQSLHDEMGEAGGSYGSVSSDYGTRLFEFVDSVGNGSLKMELTSSDYSPILDAIGQTVLTKKNRFKLRFEPTSEDDILIKIVHADGSETRVTNDQFEIDGFEIVVTDDALLLSLTDTDRIVIDYQPSSLNQ